MFDILCAYFDLLYAKIDSFIQGAFALIPYDQLNSETVIPITLDIIMLLTWISIFSSLFKAVTKPRESFIYCLLCFVTNTDFGVFNSFVVMAVSCASMYIFGPIEACVILGLSLIQFREVGKICYPTTRKEGT